MTEYGLQPSYIKCDYSTPFGQHSQTLPTVQWLPTSITGAMGSYVNWAGVPVDAEDMIDAYTAAAAPFLSADYSFNLATIYNFDTGANIFIPVAFKALAVAGTGGSTKPRKACQQTFNFRTTGGQPSKLVFLDVSVGANDFNKIPALTFNANALALVDLWTNVNWGWSGRDNKRPAGAISATIDVNDALRKQYKMV